MTPIGRKMGHFIVIEGPDGIGKSSQAAKLGDALLRCGINSVVTREPGGTDAAEQIRAMLLKPESAFDPRTEVLLHFAARADHVHRFIFPRLMAGQWVVCDRYWFSSMVYQGVGLGVPLGLMDPLCELVGLAPDLTIFLDVEQDGELARRCASRSSSADRYEAMDDVFRDKIIYGYRSIAALFEDENCVVVEASGSQKDVHHKILDVVEKRLGVRINA